MKFNIITLFPEIITPYMKIGPVKKAIELGKLEIITYNPRDYAPSPKEVDDYPFGGFTGMILKIEPLYDILSIIKDPGFVVLPSPQGKILDQRVIETISEKESVTVICGRYKGVDERITKYVDLELSCGDYILSGGEILALILIDAVSRLQEGALGNLNSCLTDSIVSSILDIPYYAHPREFRGEKVPEVLISGDHGKVEAWARKEALRRTILKRPELLYGAKLLRDDAKILKELEEEVKE
ncbi:MAG TPA: tRNA (guanosine(37)-N1)-methyltransferase TrmD [Candidatus Hydrothermia bacterium]|nr:tRNA (guanosine(37)-N1)-methyltransferase TrmD [Candidatus Hydrothermae bacterium]MDD3648897.1 tRNA (guanosine(37)-N1)-methyltransferase TrmD [Candidatus Hydrothermia bacterium]HOK23138.1 tRNA (guanosine(37)-N1)-methyltransferase TrmD [Candidatus Hydrothermia bacterium]HOP31900.1 tRNA (guanosine(37)-N1)-methyltransferase TrmD [Candidatus Hydrothermia bacterium]HRD22324.1 tRNA (guanosine(37)-N1)-methyltransferase TrmD [Candidatus Hydrothermia bacterium]